MTRGVPKKNNYKLAFFGDASRHIAFFQTCCFFSWNFFGGGHPTHPHPQPRPCQASPGPGPGRPRPRPGPRPRTRPRPRPGPRPSLGDMAPGALLGLSWGPRWGPRWVLLGPSWGPPVALLGPSWGPPAAALGPAGPEAPNQQSHTHQGPTTHHHRGCGGRSPEAPNTASKITSTRGPPPTTTGGAPESAKMREVFKTKHF